MDYGYRGRKDAADTLLVANGKKATGWPEWLKRSDGTYAFLEQGTISTPGALISGPDRTILALVRCPKPNPIAANANVWLLTKSSTYNGIRIQHAYSAGLNYLVAQYGTGAAYTALAVAGSSGKSRRVYGEWNWVGFGIESLGGTNAIATSFLNGEYYDHTGIANYDATTAACTNACVSHSVTASNRDQTAVFMAFNRRLTGPEMQAICDGSVDPRSVSGLVLFFKCNEGTGTTAIDYSGNGNNLTYTTPVWEISSDGAYSGQPFVQPAMRDWAANYNYKRAPAIFAKDKQGSLRCTANNCVATYTQWNNLIDRIAPNGTVDGGDFTVAGWVKNVYPTAASHFFFGKNPAHAYGMQITFDGTNSASGIRLYLGNGAASVYATFFPPNSWKEWQHIAVTYKAATRTVTLYLNGVFYASAVVTTFTWGYGADTANAVIFGGANRIQSTRSRKLYARVISDSEIWTLFERDAVTDRTGLLLEIDCGDANATTLVNTGSAEDILPSVAISSGSVLMTMDSPYMAARQRRLGKQVLFNTNQYITLPAELLARMYGLTELTVAVWVKNRNPWPVANAAEYIIAFASSTSTLLAAGSIVMNYVAGCFSAHNRAYSNSDASVPAVIARNNSPEHNTWDLVVTTWRYTDATTVETSIFVNGVKDATATGTVTAGGLVAERGVIGRIVSGSASNRVNNALLDDIRIWDHALTDDEVFGLWGNVATRDGLLVEYTFDNDDYAAAPTVVLDSSGNGFHGTATSFTSENHVQEP